MLRVTVYVLRHYGAWVLRALVVLLHFDNEFRNVFQGRYLYHGEREEALLDVQL